MTMERQHTSGAFRQGGSAGVVPRDPVAEAALLRAWLLSLAPVLAVTLCAIRETAGYGWSTGKAAAVATAIGTVLLAGLLAPKSLMAGRAFGTLGLAGVSAVAAFLLGSRPMLTLAFALGVTAMLFRIWRGPGRYPRGDALITAKPSIGLDISTGAAVVAWLMVPVGGLAHGVLAEAATAASLVLSVGYAARAARPPRLRSPALAPWLAGGALLAVAVAAGVAATPRLGLLIGGIGPAAWFSGELLRARTRLGGARWELVLDNPARLLVVTFLGLCAAGALLLSLPVSSSQGRSVGLLDAAFTAVSAVCVTGLVVRDTGSAFSTFGQGSILLLIQAGGLGIMTISTAAFGLLGRRLSLRHEGAMTELVSPDSRGELYRALRRTIMVTACCEGAGAGSLAWLFAAAGDEPARAAWRGLFTSVSAFCNAGFALQSDSLVSYQHQPGVLHVVALLIVAGGLSPAVVVALPSLVRRRQVGLQAKIAIGTTIALLVFGLVLLLAIEWNASLAGMSLPDRLHNAWFQSVTTRTAGFNSLDLAQLRPATVTVAMVLMFVGGCPGGTSGGIKTTTAFVLALAIVAALRGRPEAVAFGRRIPSATVFKAAAIATLGLLTVTVAVLAVQLTQTLEHDVAVFEVVSAIGTVGLSLGGTAQLDQVGKVIIMTCMFLGRVGPLTAFVMLSDRRSDPDWELPEDRLEVG